MLGDREKKLLCSGLVNCRVAGLTLSFWSRPGIPMLLLYILQAKRIVPVAAEMYDGCASWYVSRTAYIASSTTAVLIFCCGIL